MGPVRSDLRTNVRDVWEVESTMSLADVAEQVLRDGDGGPLHYREITKRAIAAGQMTPGGDIPWASVNASINVDNHRREARGELPRFVAAGGGYYRLRTAATEVEQAIEHWNDRVKRDLLNQLREIDPGTFEELIGELLEKIGFEDVEVTKRSGDQGIDVRGVLTVGGMTRVRTAIQVKRWSKNVPDKIVRELRGSIGPQEQGLIITTSDFTRAATDEAAMTDRAPVALVNGWILVEQLAAAEIGIKRRETPPILQLDESTLAGGTGQIIHEQESTATVASSGTYRSLWPLPGGSNAYVKALKKLLPNASDQPCTTDFIKRLQREFPQVRSTQTAHGYVRVLVALGLVEIDAGRLSLTPTGRAFSETHDVGIVREALRSRIVGIAELLSELSDGSRTADQLQGMLTSIGLHWETTAQIGWRLHWLESAGLIAFEDGQYHLEGQAETAH